MAVDFDVILQHQKELNKISNDMISLRRRLDMYGEEISSAWLGGEVAGISSGIDEVCRLLNGISEDLEDIGRDIVKTAQEFVE